MAYNLTIVDTPEDWETYHDIRFAELFEAYGEREYDRNHPDDYQNDNNIPFLLKKDNQGVAVVRFDKLNDGRAIIRLVAVTSALQRQGVGSELHRQIMSYAQKNKIHKILVNAAPRAINYYRTVGFNEEVWDESELNGIASDCIQMSIAVE